MALPVAARRAHPDARRMLNILRWPVLAAVALDLGLIGGQVALYPRLLTQPDSGVSLAEPIVLLVVYAAIILLLTGATPTTAPARLALLRQATVFGLLSGVLWLANLTVETWGNLPGFGLLLSAPMLLGGFLLWGIAALLAVWRTRSLATGLLAALWSALLCVLLTITYGLSLLYLALPRLSANEATDPDFARSHWPDLHAFVIANTYDAAFSHLLGALIVALAVGTVGGLIGLMARRLGSTGAKMPHMGVPEP